MGVEGCVGEGTLTEERRVAQAYAVEVREALDPSRGLGMGQGDGMTWLWGRVTSGVGCRGRRRW